MIIFVWATGATISNAQVIQLNRIDVPIEINELSYSTAGLEKNGVVAYRHIGGKSENYIEVIKYDTALHENWKGHIAVQEKLDIIHLKYDHDKLFFLLKDYDVNVGTFNILIVSMDGNYEIRIIENEIGFSPSNFEITKDAALIGGHIHARPLVLYYNFKTSKANILPGLFNEPGDLNQLKVYPDGTTDVVINALNPKQKQSLYVKNYGPEGNLIQSVFVQPTNDYSLLFGHSIRLPNGDQKVAGVYGKAFDLSEGVFFADLNLNGVYQLRYYNFGNLKNFFSYLPAKKEDKMVSKVERMAIQERKLKLQYRFLIDNIIPYQDQFIMTGEAFYPTYRNPTANDLTTPTSYPPVTANAGSARGINLSSMNRVDTPTELSGYRYSHAVVVGFDVNGKITWDNSFEINDKTTKNREQFVHVYPDHDKIILTYFFNNTICTQIIKGSEIVEGKSQTQIKPNSESEKVYTRSIKGEQYEIWYD